MSKVALITGVGGQDGSYLSELLLSKGYEVHGVVRRASSINTKRIDHIFDPESKKNIHFGNLTSGIDNLIYDIKPDEVYNLGAQSHVAVSFPEPVYTGETNAIGAARILECLRQAQQNLGKQIKYYQASSSEMFGKTPPPQKEDTPFYPASPYGAAKAYAYYITRVYRESYNMFAVNGVLFNHESERRGETFVTRKITRAAARIKLGMQKELRLGNLDALRDWGHSKDYVRAMWMMLQHDKPDDWVVSTGYQYNVRQFLEIVFEALDLKLEDYLVIDDSYKRPNEVPSLLGDSTKIRSQLGWKPEISFKELVNEMVQRDLQEASRERGC